MLKVAVVTDYFPTSAEPWAGHSAYQTLRLLARLVDLHVFYPVTTYPRRLTPALRRGKFIDHAWQPPGLTVTYIPYPALPVLSRAFNGYSIFRAVLPHVRAFRPDIVLSYIIYPNGYAAVRLARRLGCPAILTAIGSDLNRIPDSLIGRLTRSALRRADFVSTVSQDLCATAQRLGARGETTRAKLNGCDVTVFYPRDRHAARAALGLDANAEIILYVGRLDLRKGLIELIEAMSQLRASRPNARCVLLGDGPARMALVDSIARHRLAASITLIPSRSTDQVALWMAAADLVTLPSYNEGCPNVVLEALSSGRPVVATRVGGIPELMDDSSGRLIPPRDVAALAAALDEVLSQSWNDHAISRRHGRSWDDLAAELLAIFEEMLGRP